MVLRSTRHGRHVHQAQLSVLKGKRGTRDGFWTLQRSAWIQQGAIDEDQYATAKYTLRRCWEKIEIMEKLRAELKIKSTVGDELAVSETRELTNWRGYWNANQDFSYLQNVL